MKPTESYIAYFRSVWRPDSLIVDLTSTGISWSRFISGLQQQARLFCIGRIDDHFYLDSSQEERQSLELLSIFRASQLAFRFNKNVEMLNYGSHPVVENVRCLPVGAVLPELAELLEYPAKFPLAVHAAFEKCLESLHYYPGVLDSGANQGDGLIRRLVQLICSDRNLPTIYCNHQAADEAYMRGILGTEEKSPTGID